MSRGRGIVSSRRREHTSTAWVTCFRISAKLYDSTNKLRHSERPKRFALLGGSTTMEGKNPFAIRTGLFKVLRRARAGATPTVMRKWQGFMRNVNTGIIA